MACARSPDRSGRARAGDNAAGSPPGAAADEPGADDATRHDLASRLPGNDGGVRKPRFQRRKFPAGLASASDPVRRRVLDSCESLFATHVVSNGSEAATTQLLQRDAEQMSTSGSPVDQEASTLMPSSYQAMLSLLDEHGSLKYGDSYEYDVCGGCYRIYRCAYRDDTACSRCGRARRSPSTKKHVYHTIRGYMHRSFGNKQLAQMLGGYLPSRSRIDGLLLDVPDGDLFRDKVLADPRFRDDPRHLVILIFIDPFQVSYGGRDGRVRAAGGPPACTHERSIGARSVASLAAAGACWRAPTRRPLSALSFFPLHRAQASKDDAKSSVTPVYMAPLNAPPWLRMEPGAGSLLMLMPATRERGVKVDMDDLLGPLIDELVYLDAYGEVGVADASDGGRLFTCFAKLLGVSPDFRGKQSLLACGGSPGKHGCLTCWHDGHRAAPSSGKMLYGQHWRYLPLSHPLRRILRSINTAGNSLPRSSVPARLRAHRELAERCREPLPDDELTVEERAATTVPGERALARTEGWRGAVGRGGGVAGGGAGRRARVRAGAVRRCMYALCTPAARAVGDRMPWLGRPPPKQIIPSAGRMPGLRQRCRPLTPAPPRTRSLARPAVPRTAGEARAPPRDLQLAPGVNGGLAVDDAVRRPCIQLEQAWRGQGGGGTGQLRACELPVRYRYPWRHHASFRLASVQRAASTSAYTAARCCIVPLAGMCGARAVDCFYAFCGWLRSCPRHVLTRPSCRAPPTQPPWLPAHRAVRYVDRATGAVRGPCACV